MESADPILGPDQVGWWHDQGLRSVGLTHFGANTWGHGTGTQGGLYACAYPLLDALAETNIALDLTHAADLTSLAVARLLARARARQPLHVPCVGSRSAPSER